MNCYYITGTSRGIGKALAEELLRGTGNLVIGISRSSVIQHDRYKHIQIDLSDIEKVKAFQFEDQPAVKKIVLINNAGMIGDIKSVGKQDSNSIIDVFNLNLICPALLMNAFIARFSGLSCEKQIINISSGAAKNPIDAWSSYCASKAGLDMLGNVANFEEQERKRGIKIFSIYPGVIDTQMQMDIRKADPDDFKMYEKFVEYKSQNQLLLPEVVAKKIIQITSEGKTAPGIINLREY